MNNYGVFFECDISHRQSAHEMSPTVYRIEALGIFKRTCLTTDTNALV